MLGSAIFGSQRSEKKLSAGYFPAYGIIGSNLSLSFLLEEIMGTMHSSLTISPRSGRLLTGIAETPDFEAALQKILSEYIELKIERLEQDIQDFEAKWGMSFPEFAERCEAGTLGRDPYDYEVEKDFWEWEKAVTLLEHYRKFRE